MLDLGFSKIVEIGVVALIVLGPERLPRVARVAGTLFGRAQRYVRDVKDEVARDMELSDLKDLGKGVREEFDDATQTVRESMAQTRAVWDGDEHGSVGQPYTRQPYLQTISRTGRKNWRVQIGRVPLWFKQHHGVKSRVTSEAARMARHRRYAAHLGKKPHSFFS